jgi:hypothetical protein
MSRFQDVKKVVAEARKKYDGYYSQCAYFAGAFSRALVDRFEWPRELVSYERPGFGRNHCYNRRNKLHCGIRGKIRNC